MSNSNSKTVNVSGMFSSLLAVAFIVLKLCGVITWSWLWVLAPIWIPLALLVLILIVVGIVAAVSK